MNRLISLRKTALTVATLAAFGAAATAHAQIKVGVSSPLHAQPRTGRPAAART